MAATVLLHPSPPSIPLLARLDSVLRTGITGVCINDSVWAEGEAAPEGHWFAPAGMRIHRYEIAAQAQPPYILLSVAGEEKTLGEGRGDARRLHWTLPVRVDAVFQRKMSPQELEDATTRLSWVLTEDMTAAVPERERLAKDRLSDTPGEQPGVHVFELLEVRAEPLRDMEGRAMASVTFSVVCGTLAAAS